MWIVERIEDGIAVLEQGNVCHEYPQNMLDVSVQEGDVVYLENGVFQRDEQATRNRKAQILALYRKTRKKDCDSGTDMIK